MILKKFEERSLIDPPKWLVANTVYLTQTGSLSYGVSTDFSDIDMVGFCVPPKDIVFPHLRGDIIGFGKQTEQFHQWSKHRVADEDRDRIYDFTVYGIVKFFDLCVNNNPNMLEVLFTPERCIVKSSEISLHARKHRRIFLSRKSWHKFRDYAHSQLGKLLAMKRPGNPVRAEAFDRFGWDVKFGYHVVRLLEQCEMVLLEGDMDLERNKDLLMSIRAGEWSIAQFQDYVEKKNIFLDEAYGRSHLPLLTDTTKAKNLLLECLEMHYGSLDQYIGRNSISDSLIKDIEDVLTKYK